MIKILRQLKTAHANWHEVNIGNVIQETEGAGYHRKGTVTELLVKGEIVQTPFAIFKAKIKE